MSLQSYHYAWLQAHPEYSAEWLASKLREGFHVHHVDFDHSNDAPDNLVLVFGVDHLANLHGWKQRPRERRQPDTDTQKTPAAKPPKRATSRAFANPETFKRDPAMFIQWQAFMGFNNDEAARALYVSPNTIAKFRKTGASPGKCLEMAAMAVGIHPDTPWAECRKIGILNKALRETSQVSGPSI